MNVEEILASYDRRIERAKTKNRQNKFICIRCGKKFKPRFENNRFCEKCSNFAKNEFLGDNFIA